METLVFIKCKVRAVFSCEHEDSPSCSLESDTEVLSDEDEHNPSSHTLCNIYFNKILPSISRSQFIPSLLVFSLNRLHAHHISVTNVLRPDDIITH
jgi:hypothetical protein